MKIFSILFSNIIGFDGLILLLAAANGFLCYRAFRETGELYQKLRLVIFLPLSPMEGGQVRTPEEIFQVEDFVRLREKAERTYGLFTGFTALFPLLGILGTVLSLIPLVADMANLEGNFFAALTSTFWGLVFAILFKTLDAWLSSRVEDNDKNVTLLLSRIRGKSGETV